MADSILSRIALVDRSISLLDKLVSDRDAAHNDYRQRELIWPLSFTRVIIVWLNFDIYDFIPILKINMEKTSQVCLAMLNF